MVPPLAAVQARWQTPGHHAFGAARGPISGGAATWRRQNRGSDRSHRPYGSLVRIASGRPAAARNGWMIQIGATPDMTRPPNSSPAPNRKAARHLPPREPSPKRSRKARRHSTGRVSPASKPRARSLPAKPSNVPDFPVSPRKTETARAAPVAPVRRTIHPGSIDDAASAHPWLR